MKTKKENKFGKTIKSAGAKVLSAPKAVAKTVCKAGKATGKACGNAAVHVAFKIYSTI